MLTRSYLTKSFELFDAAYGESPAQGKNGLSRLYNQRIGPLTALRLHRPELTDFSMHTASCEHSLMSALMADLVVASPALETMIIPGGGKGSGVTQPLLSALGEASERLLAVLHFGGIFDRLEFTTCNELERRGRLVLGPDELPLFAPEQYSARTFSFRPFERDTPISWHPATRLLDGAPVSVPAQLALLYTKYRQGESMIGYPTSGGLGLGDTRQKAILHGLYEFLERDAINVRWYCRLPPPRVNIDLANFASRHWPENSGRLATQGFQEIGVQLVTIDHPIPIFTMTAFNRSRRDRAFVGAGGAGGSRVRALAQTLFEIAQTQSVLNIYQPKDGKRITASTPSSEMTDFLDGTIYFGFQENVARLDWYAHSDRHIEWPDVPDVGAGDEAGEYAAALKWLQKAGLNPVVVELDTACWPGIHLVRVIVPELTLACVGAHPYLGHPRYYDLPHTIGLRPTKLSFDQLNADPVPFP